jgi:membrane protein YqaA with SNARE-associated domain
MTLLTLWLTTFAVCVAGAIIPFLNTEVYLLSVSALSPRAFVWPLVAAATLGQMAGKVAMFYAGRGVLRIRSRRLHLGVGKVRARLENRPRAARLLLFSSATVGIPPLYLMAVACGTVGMGVVSFFLIGSVGRLIHFAVVALLPQYVKALLG